MNIRSEGHRAQTCQENEGYRKLLITYFTALGDLFHERKSQLRCGYESLSLSLSSICASMLHCERISACKSTLPLLPSPLSLRIHVCIIFIAFHPFTSHFFLLLLPFDSSAHSFFSLSSHKEWGQWRRRRRRKIFLLTLVCSCLWFFSSLHAGCRVHLKDEGKFHCGCDWPLSFYFFSTVPSQLVSLARCKGDNEQEEKDDESCGYCKHVSILLSRVHVCVANCAGCSLSLPLLRDTF